MKKNSPFWNRYFWWPVVSAANWIGEFINQIPTHKKKFEGPYIQNHPGNRKLRQLIKRFRTDTDPKGAPHAETKIFNHSRR